MNVSQDDYARMVTIYTNRRKQTDLQQVPKIHRRFYSIKAARTSTKENKHKITFRDKRFKSYAVEGATFRLFLVPKKPTKRMHFLVKDRYKNVLENKTLDPEILPKWMEIFVISVDPITPFEVTCHPACVIKQPTLNLFKYRQGILGGSPLTRTKRASKTKWESFILGQSDPKLPKDNSPFVVSDCRKLPANADLCCRMRMEMLFKMTPGFEFVIQPFSYDVGYCMGSCPGRHNWLNHYTNIKTMFWMMKKEKKALCCVPSKMENVEVLYLSSQDSSKLAISTWVGMKASECACT
ncbi:uncharacterized protein LOC106664697 isoform X2 [Cimex lectularius]|nr:uncharacterized protein LOC106664697 isoform X2 [Cimex lectularius]